ncbi:MAG: hypothetical protein ACRD0K_03765 [Egibacteraceae bacterium]
MALQWLAGSDDPGCGKQGICPTVWRRHPGILSVQGPENDAGLTLPSGERAVDIPDGVLLRAAKAIVIGRVRSVLRLGSR